ncbi:MAG: DUF4129 domain-containing protein [Dehalococcoidia bacterium]|nr:DUF4129 domain-containing protein [Dehalococcoidia bacterium]
MAKYHAARQTGNGRGREIAVKTDRYQIIANITFLGMEGCWLYAIMHLLNVKSAGGILSVPLFITLYPLSFIVSKLVARLQWHKSYLQTINWVIWLAVMLLMVKMQLFGDAGFFSPVWLNAVPQAIKRIFFSFEPALLILLCSILFWWLGQRMAHIRIDFAGAIGEFQFGLIIMLSTFFVIHQMGVDFSGSIAVAIAFVIFALLGLSITHAREGKSWLAEPTRGHWSSILVICIVVSLLTGLLITSLVTPDFLEMVLRGLKWIWNSIIEAILFIIGLFPSSDPEPAELPPAPAPIAPIDKEFMRVSLIPEWLRQGIRVTLVFVFLAGCVIALWQVSSQILDWMRNRLKGSGDAEITTIHGALKDDLINFLKRILLKGLSIFEFRPAFLKSRKKSNLPPLEAVSVHQVYHQFLHWAAKKGHPRETHQTPNEYFYTMANLLPEAEAEMGFLTQLYVSTRYGLSLPGENELHKLRQSWQYVKRCHFKKEL